MGLVYLLNKYTLQRNNFSWVSFTLVSFASAVFLDLKPHILIPFIALTFLHKMNFRYIVATGLIWGIGHLVVGLLFGFSHVKNWVILILEIGESQNFENFDGAAHNYWQLVTYYLKSDIKFVQFIPFFLYFVSLLVSCLIIRKVSFLGLCALAITCIGFSSYSHFYDFIPLVAISLVALHREKYSSFENFFVLFVILPQNWNIPENVIFVILTSAAYSTFRCLDDVSSNGQNQRQIIFKIIYTNFIGLFLYFSLQIFNFYLPLPEKLIDAVTTSELLILFLAILGRKGFRSLKVSFNA
jgi:hypothetical protein